MAQQGIRHLPDILVILPNIGLEAKLRRRHPKDFRRPYIIRGRDRRRHRGVEFLMGNQPMLRRIVVPAAAVVKEPPGAYEAGRHHGAGVSIPAGEIVVVLLQARVHKGGHLPVRCLGEQLFEGEELCGERRAVMYEGLLRARGRGICADGFKGFYRIEACERPGDESGIPGIEAVPVFAWSKMADILSFRHYRIGDVGEKRRFDELLAEGVLLPFRQAFPLFRLRGQRGEAAFIAMERFYLPGHEILVSTDDEIPDGSVALGRKDHRALKFGGIVSLVVSAELYGRMAMHSPAYEIVQKPVLISFHAGQLIVSGNAVPIFHRLVFHGEIQTVLGPFREEILLAAILFIGEMHRRHCLQKDVLSHIRGIHAMHLQQHQTVAQHMVGSIHIKPVLPLEFVTPAYPADIRADLPGIAARFIKCVRNEVGAPVEPGNEGYIHSVPAVHVLYPGYSRIHLGVRPPCLERGDIVRVVEQPFRNRGEGSP